MDNGSLRFTGARVPRENLLDRFGSVDSTGKYRRPCGPLLQLSKPVLQA